MSRLQKHIIIFTGLSLGVWSLFFVPKVADAFLDFCALGQLPWTRHDLSPEAVLRLMLVLFAILVCALLRKKFFRPFLHKVQPAAENSPARLRFNAAKFKPQQHPPAPAIIAILPASKPKLFSWNALWRGFSLAAAWALFALVWLAATLERMVRWLAPRLKKTGITFWLVIEPHLRAFDHWLDVTLHKSRLASRALGRLEAFWKKTGPYRRKLRRLNRPIT